MTLASFEKNPTREAQWTLPLFDFVMSKSVVSVVYPLDINGEWIGTFGQDIYLSSLAMLLDSAGHRYQGAHHILLDKNGQLIPGGPWQEQLEVQLPVFEAVLEQKGRNNMLEMSLSDGPSVLSEIEIKGTQYQIIGTIIQPMGWTYLNLIPTEEIVAPLREMLTRLILIITLMVILISILINTSVRRMIAKPVQKLVERTRMLAEGKKAEPVVSWGSNELTELGNALDNMYEKLDDDKKQISFLAKHDELTELPNRNLLGDRLAVAITNAKRLKSKVAILFIDLDQFKVVNDSFGHQLGDKLFKIVADRLSSLLRQEETLSRFGGDEFVVVLPHISGEVNVSDKAEKLLSVIQQPYYLDGIELNLSASIGISLYPDDSKYSEELIQYADTAMYESKTLGRNTYQFYTAQIREKVLRKHTVEEALRKALADNQFELFYQPKVDLKTKKVFGMEALLRWKHPEMGMVSPVEFIPLAEETGLIVDIGDWVLEQACRDAKCWNSEFPWVTNMAINLSARQFNQENFIEKVGGILNKTGVNHSLIELEITESMLMENVDKAVKTLAELRGLGLSISIDDFGTGYSSLSYLKHLPADVLKIDRSFIQDITTNSADKAIIRSILALADNLHLKVVAEGIENVDQDNALTGMNCDYAQGYYFSRPLPAGELTNLLSRNNKKVVNY